MDGQAGPGEFAHQVGLPGLRHSIGLARWWHLGTDMLWLLNGVVFYVLLFSTGQRQRIIPTTWKVFPGAVSVMIQCLSLHWPTESGWAAYNSLQLLAYFITVFVAARMALITGLGMSPALSIRIKPVSRVPSTQVARSLHFLVLCWFLFFIVIHVTLVFSTRAAAQPEPRLRRAQRLKLDRLRHLLLHHGDHDHRWPTR